MFAKDNAYNRVMTRIFDVVLVSILTTICSLPVFSAGAALTAASSVYMKMQNGVEGTVSKTYFKEFKSNLKESIFGWILLLLGVVWMVFNLYSSKENALLYGATLLLIALYGSILTWYFCVRARFCETTYTAIVNSIKFGFSFLYITMLIGAYLFGIAFLLIRFPMLIGTLPVFCTSVLYLPCVWINYKINRYIKERQLVEETIVPVEEPVPGNMDHLVQETKKIQDADRRKGLRHYICEKIRFQKKVLEIECDNKKSVYIMRLLKYFWSYYRGVLFTILLLLFGIPYLISELRKEETPKYYVAVVNAYRTEDTEVSYVLDLKECFGVADNNAILDLNYQIPYTVKDTTYQSDAATISDYDKFFLNMRNKQINAAIVPESFLQYLQELEVNTEHSEDATVFMQKQHLAFVEPNTGEKAYWILLAK